MLKAGIFLPTGANVSPEPVFVDGHTDIQTHVGGMFDVVVTDLGTFADDEIAPCDKAQFVGFVNDTGAIDGLEINYLATALFKRPIHGGVVILWGLNPVSFATDGESYDLPDTAVDFLQNDLVYVTAHNYNDATMLSLTLAECVRLGHVTAKYVNDLSDRLCTHVMDGDILALTQAEDELNSLVKWAKENSDKVRALDTAMGNGGLEGIIRKSQEED